MKKVILAIGTAAVFGTSALLVSAGPVSFTTVSNIASGQPARAADVVTAFNEIKTALETCPADMVKAGSMCVDKHEASVWDAATAGTQIASAAIAARCNVNGNDCSATDPAGAPRATAIYARSVEGVLPAVSITWYQAQQACANVGKRLLNNDEWQMAAAGTPDDAASCNIGDALVAGGTVGNTGAMAGCVSNFGANDMVGNVSEFVADWVQGNTANFPAGGATDIGMGYGNDAAAGTNPATAAFQGGAVGLPSVLYRGGRGTTGVLAGTGAGVFTIGANVAPSFSQDVIGFRCGRPL